MSQRNTAARMMHDIGLAAWFGGSLMGAVGVNGAANDVADPAERTRVASAGWARWTPYNAAAIGAHLVGGARMGDRPETGVVDRDLRSFAVANLWVTDGSTLPTQGAANPALTIMALVARAADAMRSARS